MSLLKSLADRYPLATAAFVKWLTARNTLQPYLPLLRRPIDELPVEMLYGVMVLFFSEQGIIIGARVTDRGRFRPALFIRRMIGKQYRRAHTGRIITEPLDLMMYQITSAFRTVDGRLQRAMDRRPENQQTDVLIGLDIDAIILAAKEKQLECLA